MNSAINAGNAGPILRSLFQHAISVGREVRLSTTIAQGTMSFAHIAAELVASRLQNDLSKSKIVIIGAGEMGDGVARALIEKHSPLHELTILSRTPQKAKTLAGKIRAKVDQSNLNGIKGAGMANLPEQIIGADAIVVSVASDSIVLDRSIIETASAQRPIGHERQMLIVDLGMPRNVDPLTAGLDGVSLFDMEYMVDRARSVLKERYDEYEAAGKIIERGIDAYRKNRRDRGAAPVVSALREKLEAIRANEIAIVRGRHTNSSLDSTYREDDEYWEEVDRITQRIVAKFLHQPTVTLKESMETPRGEHLIEATRELFDL
jgi:glutamyl-tRNA reductase